MSLQEKSEAEMSILQEDLLELLESPGLDGHAGNVTLMRKLNWPEDQYWSVRDSLVDTGKLVTGRGKGGSVSLVLRNPEVVPESMPVDAVIEQEAQETASCKKNELALYDPITKVIETSWVKDLGFEQHIIVNTAAQGRRSTGGTWTRPDIVIVGLKFFRHLHRRFVDFITLEVKPSGGFDVTSVYEALAHRRAATQSYVWLHYIKGQDDESLLERIEKEAEMHGIGLIIASDPSDFKTWETLVEPVRVEPDPSVLDEFIALQLGDDVKKSLAFWG